MRDRDVSALIIKVGLVGLFIVLVARAFYLQVLSPQYGVLAENNAIFKTTIYPDRGIIFDVDKKPLLENVTAFDLVITPSLIKSLDTAYLCKIIGVNKADFCTRLQELTDKNGQYKPLVFETILPPRVVAQLEENLYKLPGISLRERTIRSYPFVLGSGFLGYSGEVDAAILRKHPSYQMGDYIGLSGLEGFYEDVLRGEKGYSYFVRDNRSRVIGPYRNGQFDQPTVGGKNLYTYVSLPVQSLGEKLLANKVGSIVAIQPSTGGIISMVSSPGYDPNLLTGNQRNYNFSVLSRDKMSPLLNRSTKGLYSPGSTLKPIEALIGLQERVISPAYSWNCSGAYVYCGKKVFRCSHANPGHAKNLTLALVNSCNSYFIQLFRMLVDNNKYANVKEGLMHWKKYLNLFGMGTRTGVDIPYESVGRIPDSNHYNHLFGARWLSCNIASLGIGQGELQVTPLQLANLMCVIANRGYRCTPHFVKDIENKNAEQARQIAKLKEKQQVLDMADAYYESVIDAMEQSVEHGTAYSARIRGISVCGKTGTVENKRVVNGKVIKMPNHSLFVAFAPRHDPKIAVAVVIENSGGFGATWAAPICSLIIEQYLNGSLSAEREQQADRIAKANLLPAYLSNSFSEH